MARQPSRRDLTGQTFGSLEVLGFAEVRGDYAYWRCRCICGVEIVARGTDLRNSHTKSCGCIKLVPRDPAPSTNGCAYLPIGHGKFAKVDPEDLPKLPGLWRLHHLGYVVGWIDGKNVPLHRYIMGADDGDLVDHINGDRLDNRRANLRITDWASNAKNRGLSSLNTTGYKGVTKRGDRYVARITVDGRVIHLGYFRKPESAAYAYDQAAKKHHGPFARLNLNVPF